MIIFFLQFLSKCIFFYSKYRRIEKFFFHLRSSSASNGIAKDCVLSIIKRFCPTWRSNPRPWEYEYHALPTELAGLYDSNWETVDANDHPFSEIFGWIVFLLYKISKNLKGFCYIRPSCPSNGISVIWNCKRLFFEFYFKKLPNVGLEPKTLRWRVPCSTDWASRAVLC